MLSSKDSSHVSKILSYGKAKGIMQLIEYLPNLSPFEHILLVNNENELNVALKYLENKTYIYRQDAPIGTPIKTNLVKTDVLPYFRAIKQLDERNAMLMITTKYEVGKRSAMRGGFNVVVCQNKHVLIEFVGRGFDSRELTNGIAVHESYCLPWDEVLFCNTTNRLRTHLKSKVSEEEYAQSRERRLEYLKSSLLYQSFDVPERYTPIPDYLKEQILDDIVYPMFVKSQDNIIHEKEFWVTGVITNEGKVCPFEISTQERVMCTQKQM